MLIPFRTKHAAEIAQNDADASRALMELLGKDGINALAVRYFIEMYHGRELTIDPQGTVRLMVSHLELLHIVKMDLPPEIILRNALHAAPDTYVATFEVPVNGHSFFRVNNHTSSAIDGRVMLELLAELGYDCAEALQHMADRTPDLPQNMKIRYIVLQ